MELVVSNLAELDSAIKNQLRSDYIYMYPPRQVYQPLGLDKEAILESISQSFVAKKRLNIYVHIPFCKQICGYCNLYTTTIRSKEAQSHYIDCVLRQIDGLSDILLDTEVPTIYIGGGTPTVLEDDDLTRLLTKIHNLFPNQTSDCEIAVEVDPQTVDLKDLEKLKTIGINRINLGLQTRDDQELKTIGRRYRSGEQWSLAEEAMSVGFKNVCVDLIYGLPGQTIESWHKSVNDCIQLFPHTICCYPLTERPHTGFAKSRCARSSFSDYDMWVYADSILRSAGYVRQSHVRWAREGGGYRQKELHWGMENLMGFGAGARSYLWEVDLRTNYSIVERRRALNEFVEQILRDDFLPWEGILMTNDERLRKSVILGLHDLNLRKSVV